MIDQLFYKIGIDSNLIITTIKVVFTLMLFYGCWQWGKWVYEKGISFWKFLVIVVQIVLLFWLWAGMGQGKLHRVNRETDGYTKHIEEVAKPIKTIKEIRKEADAKKPTQLSRQDTTVKADEIQALIDSALKRSKERDK